MSAQEQNRCNFCGEAKPVLRKYSSRFRNSDGLQILASIVGIFIGAIFIISIIRIVINVPQAIFNPEWSAIQKLLEIVK